MVRDVGKGMSAERPANDERSEVEQFLTYFLGRKERKLSDMGDSNGVVSPRYCSGLLGGFGVGSSESAFRIGDEMHVTTKIAHSNWVAEVVNSDVRAQGCMLLSMLHIAAVCLTHPRAAAPTSLPPLCVVRRWRRCCWRTARNGTASPLSSAG